MEKQIYGNITNTARTQFQFDKIYPNKMEMDNECNTDGIYAGRYVLIEYGENPTRNAIELIQSGTNFFYAKFPGIQVIPNGTKENPSTIAPGVLCYVKKNDSYIFYKTQDNDTPFKFIYEYSSKDNNYNTNWNIDYKESGRGYDSSVWQKIYYEGKEKYIMIAELNTVVPNFAISLDAPGEIPEAPHFDEQSSDLNYNLHIPAQWDFRIKAATENSDEITTHIIKYDGNGKLLNTPKTDDVPADIFYNKDAFQPFNYEPITIISEEGEKWEPGKYYYQINNVYVLQQDAYSSDLDNVDFFEIPGVEEPLKQGYNEWYSKDDTNISLSPIDLLKSTEKNWESEKYYIVASTKYAAATELDDYDSEKTYFILIKDQNNPDKIYYSPVDNLSKEEYEKNRSFYYILTQEYQLDDSESFVESTVYYDCDENGNYNPITLYNKPTYKINKYYILSEKYYIKDWSEERDPEREYYKENKYDSPVNFSATNYIPGVYYYELESKKYIIDMNDSATIGRQYYRRSVPVVIEGNDKISILPTGSSGRLYNTHVEKEAQKAANDIQEISIHLPSIGRIMAEVWNLVYGKQRNELIYGSPIYDPNMYNKNGEPRYQTGIGDLSNFVTIINQVNDLIGHNIIEIESLESIWVDSANGNVIINGEVKDYIKAEDLEQYIYYIVDSDKGEEGYYRLISTEIGINEYDLKLIKMSSFDNSIDTIYETLLNIQKALGTNETEENASTTSIRGALIKLQEILEDRSKGLDFMTFGESLDYKKEPAWKDIYGTSLQQVYNRNTFVDVSVYKDDEDCQKYYSHKLLMPYKKETIGAEKVSTDSNNENYYRKLCGLKRFELKKITENNFKENKNNLYIYREIEKENNFRLLATEAVFDEEETYYVKKENVNTYESFDSYLVSSEQEAKICFDNEKDENGNYLADYSRFTVMTEEITAPLKGYYVIVLPYYYYWTTDENGIESKVTSDANIFTDIFEYNRYVIMHDDPKPSKNNENNTIHKPLKELNNFSALEELYVNKKGHIYAPEKETFTTAPQTIISHENLLQYLDVPIGTLVYTTTEKQPSIITIEIINPDGRKVNENDITVSLSTFGYKNNIENNVIQVLEGSIIKYDIKNNNHRYYPSSGEIIAKPGEYIEQIKLKFDKKLKAPIVQKNEKLDTPIVKLKEKLNTPLVKEYKKLDTPIIKLQEKLDTPIVEIKEEE